MKDPTVPVVPSGLARLLSAWRQITITAEAESVPGRAEAPESPTAPTNGRTHGGPQV
jgi:hypothetical protein